MNSFTINWNLISALSMAVSAFFAGSFLQGERMRKAEFRESIEQIRMEQAAIMQRVDEVNEYVKLKEIEMISQIDSAYLVLDDLNQARESSWRKIRATEKRIITQQNKLRLNVDRLKQEINQKPIQFISN